MSRHVEGWIWKHSREGGTRLLVLLSLADVADNDGLGEADYGAIAYLARCSESQAMRVVKALEADGLIEVKRTPGRGRKNVYRILGVPRMDTQVRENTRKTRGKPLSAVVPGEHGEASHDATLSAALGSQKGSQLPSQKGSQDARHIEEDLNLENQVNPSAPNGAALPDFVGFFVDRIREFNGNPTLQPDSTLRGQAANFARRAFVKDHKPRPMVEAALTVAAQRGHFGGWSGVLLELEAGKRVEALFDSRKPGANHRALTRVEFSDDDYAAAEASFRRSG